ncbi:Imm26 family immunity protein [Breznakiellaceae bacterium SP9]
MEKIKIKAGDILSFELNTEEFTFTKKYGFAKVLTKNKLGDVIEVYNYFSDDKNDYLSALNSKPLFDQPIILDGYSIFWKRSRGKWELLKRDDSFEYTEKAKVKYKYGPKGFFKLIDLNGTSYENLSQEEIEKYPDYSPYSNYAILHRINYLLEK